MPMKQALIALALTVGVVAVAAATRQAPPAALVTADNLRYVGAFRVPPGFDYGGTAPAFNAERRSLYLVGGGNQYLGEITIPSIRSGRIEELDRAAILQPIIDPTEGRLATVASSEVRIGGLALFDGQLLISAYQYYDADQTQRRSHFVRHPDLSMKGTVRGPYEVGEVGAGFTSGYFAVIPPEWRSEFGAPLLNGQCCIPIITRTSFGPAAFAVDPARFGDPRSRVPATPLLYYPSSNPTIGGYNSSGTLFNGTTTIMGMVFPNGTRSVLFFGTQGLGKFCYGTGEQCGDPIVPYQGNHGYPYQNQVWAYDAADLLRVRRGRAKPWDIRPYATWKIDLPFAAASGRLWGATYDAASRRIYVAAGTSDGDAPLIHVLEVSNANPGMFN